MERVVNIVGMGRGSLDIPDTGENWGINYSYIYGKMDKLFFMDSYQTIREHENPIESKKAFGITFSEALDKYPDMELISSNSADSFVFNDEGEILKDSQGKPRVIKAYPLDDAVRLNGGIFFTSTMAYVIAYAILQKVDRIRLYGMEVWSGAEANEYQHQRPCLDHWLSFARGKGIKVEVPWYLIHANTNYQNLYGYVGDQALRKF